jgi:hypothetical protein
MTVRQFSSPLWFIGPLIIAYTAAMFVMGMLPRLEAPGVVAVALTLDLVILVPLLYYAVLVRGRGWPAVTVVPVFLASMGATSLLLPDQHHAMLDMVGLAVPIAEVGLLGYISLKAWRIVRLNRAARTSDGDFYDRMRQTMRGAFDVPAVTGVLAYEVSLFHYAFTMRPNVVPAHGFTYHRRGGYEAVFAAILMVAAVELVAVHFLLYAWIPAVAYIHAGLSLYGIIWLTGDYRAMRRRPHEVRDSELRIRFGLRWDVRVAWSQIARVDRFHRSAFPDGFLNTVPIGDPRYIIELGEPVSAIGPYGVLRTVRRIGMAVDDPDSFEERLRSLGVPIQP